MLLPVWAADGRRFPIPHGPPVLFGVTNVYDPLFSNDMFVGRARKNGERKAVHTGGIHPGADRLEWELAIFVQCSATSAPIFIASPRPTCHCESSAKRNSD